MINIDPAGPGGSSIGAGKIAGHATVSMTGDYAVVQLKRQAELTRAIQERLEEARRRTRNTEPEPLFARETEDCVRYEASK